MLHVKKCFLQAIFNKMSFFFGGGGGGGGGSSVLCMGIGSTVEYSFTTLALYFSLLAHPCTYATPSKNVARLSASTL